MPQAGTPVLRRGAFPGVQAPCETVGKGRFAIFETTSGFVLGRARILIRAAHRHRATLRFAPSLRPSQPPRLAPAGESLVGWRGPQRGYPATAVTAPGRYAARPAYAAAPLEKRGRPARADLGAHGPKPALRFAGPAVPNYDHPSRQVGWGPRFAGLALRSSRPAVATQGDLAPTCGAARALPPMAALGNAGRAAHPRWARAQQKDRTYLRS